MADFNQVPADQPSLAFTGVSLGLGSAANTATLAPDETVFTIDGSGYGETIYAKRSAVGPQWRRESKLIRANER